MGGCSWPFRRAGVPSAQGPCLAYQAADGDDRVGEVEERVDGDAGIGRPDLRGHSWWRAGAGAGGCLMIVTAICRVSVNQVWHPARGDWVRPAGLSAG
jgi:hypothetical protein